VASRGLGHSLRHRKTTRTTHTEPFSDEVFKYDKWLLSRTDELTLGELIELWSHAMWCAYVCYCDPDCDPAVRHQVLLNLRDHFRRYLTLPERLQLKLWPMSAHWYGRFVAEECYGTA